MTWLVVLSLLVPSYARAHDAHPMCVADSNQYSAGYIRRICIRKAPNGECTKLRCQQCQRDGTWGPEITCD